MIKGTDRTTLVKKVLFYVETAAVKLLTLPLCRSIRGAGRLPTEPFLIAANHRSLLDGVVLVNEFNALRRRPIHIIAYQEPFANIIVGPLMKLAGCLPFDRGKKESRSQVMQQALGYLRAGEPVALFPEAHLSTSNKLRRARPGLALLALESGVPVVPVGLRGTEKVLQPITGKLSIKSRASLEIGFPLDFSEFRAQFLQGDVEDRNEAIALVSDQVMLAISRLSRQDYPYTGKRIRKRGQ